jgi:5-methylcytosine-specific restriction endonuclease McrA
MLREIKHARFACRRTLFGRRWRLHEPARASTVSWRHGAFTALERAQAVEPVPLLHRGDRTYWWFEDRVWWEDDALSAADVLALVRDRERRARRRLERAHAALAGEAAPRRRTPIAGEVRRAVFERDGGRCAQCGARFDLQYDHVIPLALGGASTAANLQLLCAPCNRAKGAALA